MRWRRRELAPALALILLALTACHSRPAARPTTSPPASSPASVTPSPSPTERSYVYGVLGDFGVDARAVHDVVAEMRRFAGRLDAVVTTGDNAYCCGTAAQEAFAKRVLSPLNAPVYHQVRTAKSATPAANTDP